MRNFINHKGQQTLHTLRAFHFEILEFSATHPEATLTDFEHHLRRRVEALGAELEANERAAGTAVTTKPLSGPLADPERQRLFRHSQESQPPSGNAERDAWWGQRRAVLDEIKEQGLKEALDWECRNCGASPEVACRTAGGRAREPHFLRATDAELPYLQAYGLG
ncbi:hypothetical protein ACFYXM_24705 [Streptomyces sp. NPDC002476]|uniref:zinc finger domain-containing protein n=1 Tax=Streptomyces sp. NPDC002476 TaxID=3364648 RepID=UPI0036BF4FBC